MNHKLSLIKISIFLLIITTALPAFADSQSFQEALEDIASGHYSAHMNTVIGNFTWEDSGIGTRYSEVLRTEVKDAVETSKNFTYIHHTGPVFNDPDAVMLLGEESWSGANYIIYGTYKLEGNDIIVDTNLFSFVFNSLVGSKQIKLPLSAVPSGIRLIPENSDILAEVDESLGQLYGESDLEIYVTTGKGEGGVYHDGEDLRLHVLASEDCYIKIFHIDVTGKNTTLIFPNPYESNNFLPGGRFLLFPGEQAPFKFTLTSPYGSEYIKIVASTQQFKNIGNAFQNLGAATRGLILEEVQTEVREVMAEAKVSYTILE